jgi:hypothetical protein
MFLLYLTYIVPGSILIPLIVFAVRYPYTGVAERLIGLYLVVSSLINLAALFLSTHNSSNLWLLHIYTAAEAVLLLLFFRRILTSKTLRRLVAVLVVLFPMACLLNAIYFQSASLFNTYTRPVEALFCIGLCAAYWLEDDGHKDTRWAANSLNWIVTAILIYFASSFLLFLFSNALLKASATSGNGRLLDLLWGTHATLVLVMYLLIAIGFRNCKMPQYG